MVCKCNGKALNTDVQTVLKMTPPFAGVRGHRLGQAADGNLGLRRTHRPQLGA